MTNFKDYYNISTEYNAIDIPRMISKKATDKIRSLSSNTAIRVDNLDKLVGFYTGKLTNIGEFINILDPLAKVPGMLYKGIVTVIKKIKEADEGGLFKDDSNNEPEQTELPNDKKELSSTYLSYYQFFMNVNKINWKYPSNYTNVNVVTHSVISELLNTSLNEKWRDATPAEIHSLHLFKPDKIRQEMERAMNIMRTKSAEVNKESEWESIYSTAAKDANRVMDFILKNISDTNGVVKFKE